MSTHLRDKQDKILKIIEHLAVESAMGKPIIVEGKKDMEALRTLGVRGKIVMAKTGGKSRLDLVSEIERAGSQEVILLLDFDRRGREWTAFLRQNLEKARIRTDMTFRRELIRFAGRELKDVEGLAGYMQTLSEKVGQA